MFFDPDLAPDAPFGIAFVGNDGAGKSTISRTVVDQLKLAGAIRRVDKWDVIRDDIYPEYAFMGDDLPLLRNCASSMQEVTRTLFLFWSLHGTLKPDVIKGFDFIILDGYWPKHAASEILYSGHSSLVQEAVKLMPRPNLTFYMDLAPEESWRRRSGDASIPLVPYECGLDHSLSEASFIAHQTAVRSQLLEWCDTFSWHRIDASRERGIICNEVIDIIKLAKFNVA